jgi:photosystem II stability/assembly factor-like uncharacterized protein
MKRLAVLSILALFLLLNQSFAKGDDESEKSKTKWSDIIGSMKFRSIGPGVTSGRITDIAVNPENKSVWYIAFASSGLWKTTNSGVTFKPVFANQGSYSVGCITLDSDNPNVIWLGSGENNSQRSVPWGDGIYKSLDGGISWKNMGLKESEHIAKILIDPRDHDIIYVAAQGPLWGPGGDRGLYKSTDGGETWDTTLYISKHTGVTDVIMDPRNPDVLYAASYQRARHVWTLIDGGPEAAVYKTTNAGETWNKLGNGLPGGELGRIGLAISPVNPDYVFATIEEYTGKGGFYASTDRGASWTKRNPWFSHSAQYYTEIFCDPKNSDLLYVADTYTRISYDGGRTFKHLGNNHRHVDDHALWIDQDDTKHILIGGDGGLYESFDRGKTWRFFSNLPCTQDYRIGIDNAEPFYNVYYGTQDNNSWGGPSRTNSSGGITNDFWYLVVGGDGYQARVDPNDPNIVYGQWQYGNLVRFDRKSGEVFYIKPQPEKGELLRWNWDTPLLISHHSPTRIYIAANRIYRSDNRGDKWTAISPDLTRQIDRNQLPIMGKLWGPDAVAKNASTSLYGNIVALAESPINENLLIAGTDDGLIQITEDGGKNWEKISSFPSVPETTYVSDIFVSQHDENVIYATFNNHKRADFKPYVLKSNDKGKSWKMIAKGIPDNEPVWTIYEDHVNPELLFLGTEYSFYISTNGGESWFKHKSGLPTIAVRDIEIQKRENDVCLATFGRGIYILDDYSPLRKMTDEVLEKDAYIFPVKDALMYIQDDSFSKQSQGSSFYRANNPPFGATFTYYLKESIKTKKQLRKEAEKKAEKDGKTIKYPTLEELQAEDEEQAPYLIFKISDMDGNVIRLLKAPAMKGVNKITWDMRYPDVSPVSENLNINKNAGMPVIPGQYKVCMAKNVNGVITKLTEPVVFTCKLLNNSSLPASDRKALAEFQQKTARLQNAVFATASAIQETKKKTKLIKNALMSSVNVDVKTLEKVRDIEAKLQALSIKMTGNTSISKRNENQTPSIVERLTYVIWGIWATNNNPTETQKQNYKIASEQLTPVIDELRQIVSVDIASLKAELQKLNAPWIPGTLPQWNPK